MAHRFSKLPDPTETVEVRAVATYIRKNKTDVTRKKLALDVHEMRCVARAAAARPWPRCLQEWASISLTWFGGFRSSETVTLDIDDLEIGSDAMRVLIIKSKTDKYGRGDVVTIERLLDDPEICAVAAVEAWIAVLGEKHGPLFRSIWPGKYIGGRLGAEALTRAVKRFAPAMQLPKEEVASHSLRAGCVTQLMADGVDELAICAHTRHASIDSMRGYDRPRRPRYNIARALVS
jgi:integrase